MGATTGTEGGDKESAGCTPPFVMAGVPSDGKGVSPPGREDRAGTPPEGRDGTDDGIDTPSVEDDELRSLTERTRARSFSSFSEGVSQSEDKLAGVLSSSSIR